MARRNIIVIGASMGGVEALPRLVAGLPRELDAAIFIVMHLSASGPSYLTKLLKNPAFEIRAATDGEPIRPRTVYVAVPDRHLLIEGDHVRLTRGPRESHARPSVDALFRSAAFAAGRGVMGVVLTGLLDDGTAGLWSIKDRGGIAIVQSPDEAAEPSMPRNAIAHVAVDEVLRLEEIPARLLARSREELQAQEGQPMPDKKLEIEVGISLQKNALEQGVRGLGEQAFFTCPDCHGSMTRIKEGAIVRYRCHTGHSFSAQALAKEGISSVESTLWAALAQLEEHYVLLEELKTIEASREAGDATALSQRAERTRQLMRRIRELAIDAVPDPAS